MIGLGRWAWHLVWAFGLLGGPLVWAFGGLVEASGVYLLDWAFVYWAGHSSTICKLSVKTSHLTHVCVQHFHSKVTTNDIIM